VAVVVVAVAATAAVVAAVLVGVKVVGMGVAAVLVLVLVGVKEVGMGVAAVALAAALCGRRILRGGPSRTGPRGSRMWTTLRVSGAPKACVKRSSGAR